jgi:ABC-type transport system substrate-binding protein
VKAVLATLAAAALASSATGAPGPTLRLGALTAPTADPALAGTPDSRLLVAATCSPLYTLDARGRAIPLVAAALPTAGRNAQRPKQWTTYTIRVKRGFRFENGLPVTAFSFADAIARDASPDMASPAVPLLRPVVGLAAVLARDTSVVSGVRAVDDTTLEISTLRRVPDLAQRLAEPYFCPVQPGTPIAPEGLERPPSSGPYAVTTNTPEQVTLTRNPYYRGPRRAAFAAIVLRGRLGVDGCRREVKAGTRDLCLDALPQHARTVSFPALVRDGWVSPRLGCLAWDARARIDLTAVCLGKAR